MLLETITVSFLVIDDTDIRTVICCMFWDKIMAFIVGLEFWVVMYLRDAQIC
jgi:hypothetical protein